MEENDVTGVFDATRYIDSTIAELVDEFGTKHLAVLSNPESRAIDVIVERVVHDVRTDSTANLARSSTELGDLSRTLSESSEARIRIDTLATVVQSAAAQFTDSARPAVLRSFEGKAEKALVHLAIHGKPVRLIDLRTHLEVQESNGSYLVGELVRAGLVYREKSGRSVTLWLTEAGRTYAALHLGQEIDQEIANERANADELRNESAHRRQETLRPQTQTRVFGATAPMDLWNSGRLVG
jgi:DNA-binding MarR family transcriptional regulator